MDLNCPLPCTARNLWEALCKGVPHYCGVAGTPMLVNNCNIRITDKKVTITPVSWIWAHILVTFDMSNDTVHLQQWCKYNTIIVELISGWSAISWSTAYHYFSLWLSNNGLGMDTLGQSNTTHSLWAYLQPHHLILNNLKLKINKTGWILQTTHPSSHLQPPTHQLGETKRFSLVTLNNSYFCYCLQAVINLLNLPRPPSIMDCNDDEPDDSSPITEE